VVVDVAWTGVGIGTGRSMMVVCELIMVRTTSSAVNSMVKTAHTAVTFVQTSTELGWLAALK
jgi:hypothetical protein